MWDEWTEQPEATTTVGSALPDVVVVAAHPSLPDGGEPRIQLELATLATGATAVLAFTSTTALVDTLGAHQPWVAVSAARLHALLGPRTVLLDPGADVVAPRWTADAVRELAEAQR